MTHLDTFVGRLRHLRFDWTDEGQKLHASDIEFLTESFLDGDAFRSMQRLTEAPAQSRQLDWGSWAMPATKAEILTLIAKWKPGWDLPDPGDETHKPKLQRARCKAMIEALPPEEAYVLVIEEF
jgi:hypothetical protein